MAQHDQVINNNPGGTVLIDLNAAFAAIFSSSSGPIEPLVKQAGQLWFDTSSATLNLRNAANSGWIEFTLGFDASNTYTKAAADARFAIMANVYSKTEADAAFAQLANTDTKAVVDAKFNPIVDASFGSAADPTKKSHFDFSLITAGQDRAIRVPDKAPLAFGGWELIIDEDVPSFTTRSYLNLSAYHALWLVTDFYAVSVSNVPIMQLSSDNGATFISTTTYYYNFLYSYNSASAIYGASVNTAPQLYLGAGGILVGPANHGAVSELKLWGFNKPRWTCGIQKNAYHSSASGIANMSQSCGHQAATAMNAFKIFSNDGNPIAGRVTLHGLRG